MKIKLGEEVYIPIPSERFTCRAVLFYMLIMKYVKHQILYIHLVLIVINCFIILKNVLKYLTYENRI